MKIAAAKQYDTVVLKFIPISKDKKKHQIMKRLGLRTQPYSQVNLVLWAILTQTIFEVILEFKM